MDRISNDLIRFVARHKCTNSLFSEMALAEVYEETYRIAEHSDPRRPMSLVAMNPTEDNSQHDLLYRTLFEFANYELHKVFQISLFQYLECPPYVQRTMIEIAVKRAEAMSGKLKNIEEELQR